MRTMNRVKKLLVSLCIAMSGAAWAQTAPQKPAAPGSLDVAVLYTADSSDRIPGARFWMQGGTVQLHGQFWRGLGVVADITGDHSSNIGTPGVGLDMVTATFGPRYTWQPSHRRVAVFGQALVGESNALHSVFPIPTGVTDSSNSLALKIGGGLNYRLGQHLAVRAFEGDWVRTQFPNGTTDVQNHLQLGAGVILHLR